MKYIVTWVLLLSANSARITSGDRIDAVYYLKQEPIRLNSDTAYFTDKLDAYLFYFDKKTRTNSPFIYDNLKIDSIKTK